MFVDRLYRRHIGPQTVRTLPSSISFSFSFWLGLKLISDLLRCSDDAHLHSHWTEKYESHLNNALESLSRDEFSDNRSGVLKLKWWNFAIYR